jgi:hypothetical protein
VAFGKYALIASSIENPKQRGLGEKAISRTQTGLRILGIRCAAAEICCPSGATIRWRSGSGQSHRLGITKVRNLLIAKELNVKFLLENRVFRDLVVSNFHMFVRGGQLE